MNRISFLSGLPRSGSTLLINLLNQNPLLYATNESNFIFEIMNGTSNGFYNHVKKPYIVDNNRNWGCEKSLPFLKSLPNAKVVVTVRPILEILASFIRLAESSPNNYIDRFMKEESFRALSYRHIDDARCDWLMRPYGQIDENLSSINYLLKMPNITHVIKYEDLSNNPQKVMNSLYNFYELDNFNHDFDNVKTYEKIDDETIYGIPTMHKIRSKVEKSDTDYKNVLSDYVIKKYGNALDFMQDSL